MMICVWMLLARYRFNEAPSAKRGKFDRNPRGRRGCRGFNEAPSAKRGKLDDQLGLALCGFRFNEAPSAKRGK